MKTILWDLTNYHEESSEETVISPINNNIIQLEKLYIGYENADYTNGLLGWLNSQMALVLLIHYICSVNVYGSETQLRLLYVTLEWRHKTTNAEMKSSVLKQ